MRNSIFQLCNDEKLDFLRNIVIGDSKPQQDAKFNRNKFLEKHSLDKLNEEQKNAVIGCMSVNNFHIVEGGAKTGKTTTVVSLLEVLRRTKKKVLVVSSPNDKLDNLLVKASQQNVSFIRVANTTSEVDYRIKDKVKIISSFKNFEEIDDMIENENIYATTCLDCQHGILGLFKRFDICIIEDADCISEPVALCSLILCKKFIMIGNTKDVITEDDKKIDSFDEPSESLFQRLARKHKNDVSKLTCTDFE